ncbi:MULTISPECIES: thermonuclease family protein [Comamonas]|uniref:Thermonuclease family protein n=1 Tax=Comamonas squillarum TaxID=2977320 RepID=A0ABY6A154_9BURK|nr:MULTISPECIES: thermonuclease family protein [Comamonas]UXC19992.1 thermonuclease family protein [Comamonas sp. PR12]
MLSAIAICLIVGISDGDTLTARCGAPGAYEQIKIRLGGIDAPESRQPFGQKSKQNLSDLCFQAQAEITPKSKDRYGRTIADVRCGGLDAGQHQVATGMAWYYVKYGKGYEWLQSIEESARVSELGVWSEPNPVPPWDWRKSKR